MENNGDSSHISIEITPMYEGLVSSIKDRMERAASQGCICKVNNEVMGNYEDSKAYVPDKVSIGPFHHGKEDLRTMENQKWRYLYALLNRKPNLEATLNSCVEALKALEPKARLFYTLQDHDACILSDTFVKMMLVDGGFIIELFLKAAMKRLRRRNDPIFSTPGMLYRVRVNLIMLENQIPFFILQELFRIVPVPKQCNLSITDLAFIFFKSMIPGDNQLHKEKYSQESNHLLDLVRHCYLPTIQRIQAKQEIRINGFPGPATTLRNSGIKLKRARRKVENLLDIKLNKGILEIPTIHIHHFTETLFRNFIAYEQCPCHDNSHSLSLSHSQHISSYALLIKSLVQSNKDVKFLENQDILLTYDNVDDNDIYQLFDRLGKCALHNNQHELKDFYYDGLCEQVCGYKRRNFWRSRRKKKKDAPWSMLYVAAFLLLALTFFATLFSILAFFRHH